MMKGNPMKKFISACLLTTFLAFPAHADKQDKLKELVTLMNYDKLINETIEQQVYAPLDCIFMIPQNEKQDIKNQLTQAFNLRKLIDSIVSFLSQNLTEEELDDLLAFYKTPGGKKLITLQTALSQFTTDELTAWFKDIDPQMRSFASQLEAKYRKRSGNEAQMCMTAAKK